MHCHPTTNFDANLGMINDIKNFPNCIIEYSDHTMINIDNLNVAFPLEPKYLKNISPTKD